MIDPKLNELPEKTRTGSPETGTSAQPAKPQSGLSVNETVAAEANLSAGSPGTDTSGVRAGAGAGAGNVYVTPPARGESPAPNVVPGPAGSGTTPLSTTAPGQIPTQRDESERYGLRHDEIAAYAYRCWHERGCPKGSPEVDWYRAEQELLRERAQAPKTFAATA